MEQVSVRYIVDDIDAAVDFYSTHLPFQARTRPGPGFAMLQRGNLRLLLNTPGGGGGAGQTTSDGRVPEAGGWNRFQIEVDDLDAAARSLRQASVSIRGDVISGRGGKQILLEDPSGNPVELFEPIDS